MKTKTDKQVDILKAIVMLIICGIIALAFLSGCKTAECITKNEQEKRFESPFDYHVMAELNGNTIRYYYTAFLIERNGKFKTWTVRKIYLSETHSATDQEDAEWLIKSNNTVIGF